LGPTGGFLVGLLPAAVIAGLAGNYREKEEKGTRYLLLCAITGLAAMLVIYGCGISWLKARGSLSWRAAIQIALLPFLIGDAVKLIVALRLAISFKGRIARFIDPTLA